MSDQIGEYTTGAAVSSATGSDAPAIEISAVSDLSYAMAHCRIPVIDHITVRNPGRGLHGAHDPHTGQLMLWRTDSK